MAEVYCEFCHVYIGWGVSTKRCARHKDIILKALDQALLMANTPPTPAAAPAHPTSSSVNRSTSRSASDIMADTRILRKARQRGGRPSQQIELTCAHCQGPFRVRPSMAHRKFCSRKCCSESPQWRAAVGASRSGKTFPRVTSAIRELAGHYLEFDEDEEEMDRRLGVLLEKCLTADPLGTITALVPDFAKTKMFTVKELVDTAVVWLNLEVLVQQGIFRRVGRGEYELVKGAILPPRSPAALP